MHHVQVNPKVSIQADEIAHLESLTSIEHFDRMVKFAGEVFPDNDVKFLIVDDDLTSKYHQEKAVPFGGFAIEGGVINILTVNDEHSMLLDDWADDYGLRISVSELYLASAALNLKRVYPDVMISVPDYCMKYFEG